MSEALATRLEALAGELTQIVGEAGAEVAVKSGGDMAAVADVLHVGSDLIAGVFGYAAQLRKGDFKPEPVYRKEMEMARGISW